MPSQRRVLHFWLADCGEAAIVSAASGPRWPVERSLTARLPGRTSSARIAQAGGPVLLATAAGRCVFHDAAACRCRIQRALGHAALPLACRQFPRVSAADPRGTSVTLSHYCPTAARLLEDDGAVTIDLDPAAFPPDGEYVGLERVTALPPLLRPDMLMDWDSWWECERLASKRWPLRPSPERRGATGPTPWRRLRTWRPTRARSSIASAPVVRGACRRYRTGPATTAVADLNRVLDAIRPSTGPPASPRIGAARLPARSHGSSPRTPSPTGRLTSARGSDMVRSIDAAHALATRAGVRQADLLLRHLADPAALARGWNEQNGLTSRTLNFERSNLRRTANPKLLRPP